MAFRDQKPYAQPDRPDTSMDWAADPRVAAAKANPRRSGFSSTPMALPVDTGAAPQRAQPRGLSGPNTDQADFGGRDADNDRGFEPDADTDDAPRQSLPTGGSQDVTRSGNMLSFGGNSIGSGNGAALDRVQQGLQDPHALWRQANQPFNPSGDISSMMQQVAAKKQAMMQLGEALHRGRDNFGPSAPSQWEMETAAKNASRGAYRGADKAKFAALVQQGRDANASDQLRQQGGQALDSQALSGANQMDIADIQGQNALAGHKYDADTGLAQTALSNEGALNRANVMADANRYNAALDYDAAVTNANAAAASQQATREDAQRKDFRKSAAAQSYVNLLRKNPNDPILKMLSDVDPKTGKMVPNEYKIQAFYDNTVGSDPAAARRAGMDPRGPVNAVQAAHSANALNPGALPQDGGWFGIDTPGQDPSMQYPALPEPGSAPANPALEAQQPRYRQNARNAGR